MYTLPDGLQSMNGSSSAGGCQPEICIMMSIGKTGIKWMSLSRKHCSSPVNGVLNDVDIPSIDATQCGTWASGQFAIAVKLI